MNVRNYARLIIYRVNQKGLEIFLVHAGENSENWQIPEGVLGNQHNCQEESMILLDTFDQHGKPSKVLAIEGDWHDIPSVRSVIKADVRFVKNQIKQKFPDLEQGKFYAVKEACKKVLPHQYACLKELKDIILEKNQVKYI